MATQTKQVLESYNTSGSKQLLHKGFLSFLEEVQEFLQWCTGKAKFWEIGLEVVWRKRVPRLLNEMEN